MEAEAWICCTWGCADICWLLSDTTSEESEAVGAAAADRKQRSDRVQQKVLTDTDLRARGGFADISVRHAQHVFGL